MVQQQSSLPHWHVSAQQATNRTDASGRFISGVLVTFSADNGVSDSVFVPDNQYYPDMVKAMILARLQQHTDVLGLKG